MKFPLFNQNLLRHGFLLSGVRCSSATANIKPMDIFDYVKPVGAISIDLNTYQEPESMAGNLCRNEGGQSNYSQMVRKRKVEKYREKSNSCKGGGAIAGKNIIFVAGLGGIGMNTCREIVKKGPKSLILLDTIYNPEAICELQELCPNAKVAYYPYDVTVPLKKSKKLFKKIFKKFKKIDLLINGAGILNEQAMEKTIAVNFTGTVNTTTAIMDFWDKRKGGPGGVIANICSLTAFNPLYQVPVYCASTCAAFSFTYSLAKLMPITGVSAYSINPGITRTPLVRRFKSWLDVEPCTAELLREHPSQSAKQAGKSFVKAIEANKNGVIWKLDLGKLEQIKYEGPKYWESGI